MASTDGDDLRNAVEQLTEMALGAALRRPTPMEVRAMADRVYVALEDYIDRRVIRLRQEALR